MAENPIEDPIHVYLNPYGQSAGKGWVPDYGAVELSTRITKIDGVIVHIHTIHLDRMIESAPLDAMTEARRIIKEKGL